MVVAWVEKWRERVIRTENLDKSTSRTKSIARIEELKRKQVRFTTCTMCMRIEVADREHLQLKLSQKIQWHEEEYDRGTAHPARTLFPISQFSLQKQSCPDYLCS